MYFTEEPSSRQRVRRGTVMVLHFIGSRWKASTCNN